VTVLPVSRPFEEDLVGAEVIRIISVERAKPKETL
jgi:hypothetical protein